MYKSIVLVLVIIFVGCTSNTIYKKPKNLIPKDQMVDLLVDMHLANAAYNVKNKHLKKKQDYMPLVYDKYGIDSIRFQTSNVYYMSDIDVYEEIYKKVQERVKFMLDTTLARQKLKDSLKLSLPKQKIKSRDSVKHEKILKKDFRRQFNKNMSEQE